MKFRIWNSVIGTNSPASSEFKTMWQSVSICVKPSEWPECSIFNSDFVNFSSIWSFQRIVFLLLLCFHLIIYLSISFIHSCAKKSSGCTRFVFLNTFKNFLGLISFICICEFLCQFSIFLQFFSIFLLLLFMIN